MLGTAPLDSFQLIIGFYLLYVTIKGEGNMYRFSDVPEEYQPKIAKTLRIIYGCATVVCLLDGTVCVFGQSLGLSEAAVNIISPVCTVVLIALCFGAIIWLRSLAKKK